MDQVEALFTEHEPRCRTMYHEKRYGRKQIATRLIKLQLLRDRRVGRRVRCYELR